MRWYKRVEASSNSQQPLFHTLAICKQCVYASTSSFGGSDSYR